MTNATKLRYYMFMNKAIGLLKQKGARLTQTRQFVIDILEQRHLPMTELEIRELLAKKGKVVNKTTTYRELIVLSGYGIIHQVDFGDGKIRYELAGHHHHHLVCTDCGEVKDIEVKHDVGNIEKRVLTEQKFKITRHSLEFFGLCKNCNN